MDRLVAGALLSMHYDATLTGPRFLPATSFKFIIDVSYHRRHIFRKSDVINNHTNTCLSCRFLTPETKILPSFSAPADTVIILCLSASFT